MCENGDPVEIKKKYLALDIGGVSTKAGLVTSEGEVLGCYAVDSHRGGSREQVLRDIAGALAPFRGEDLAGMGVGFPAYGDFKNGVLLTLNTPFPSLHRFPLGFLLENEIGVPTRITTDANLFALGVMRFGEGQTYKDFVAVSLGSGTGVGVVQNGRLVEGMLGPHPAIVEFYNEWDGTESHDGLSFPALYGADGETLYRKVEDGDEIALRAFERIGQSLGPTLNWLHDGLMMDTFILGGGVSNSYDYFYPVLESELGSSGFTVFKTGLENASLLGAVPLLEE